MSFRTPIKKVKGPKRVNTHQIHFMAVKKSRKRSGFVVY